MKDEESDGNRAPEHTPQVGGDPQSLPQEGVHKAHVHLDREKVARADQQREMDRRAESEEERAARVKNG